MTDNIDSYKINYDFKCDTDKLTQITPPGEAVAWFVYELIHRIYAIANVLT